MTGHPPSCRHGHISVAVGTDIYIHGGMSGIDMFDDLYKFNSSMWPWGLYILCIFSLLTCCYPMNKALNQTKQSIKFPPLKNCFSSLWRGLLHLGRQPYCLWNVNTPSRVFILIFSVWHDCLQFNRNRLFIDFRNHIALIYTYFFCVIIGYDVSSKHYHNLLLFLHCTKQYYCSLLLAFENNIKLIPKWIEVNERKI